MERCDKNLLNSAASVRHAAILLPFLLTFWLAALVLSLPTSLASCLQSHNVAFLYKSSPDWDKRTKSWNIRLQYTPAAVALPRSIGEIQAAVSCGVKQGLRVSAKGGGHSFGSFGLGGEDGHVVIDLEQMHNVTLHPDTTATIQPGARLGHVALELYNQGKRAIAHGSCPSVGLAGHVLHGGYGFSTRTYGLTLDWLLSATVILANGSIVRCSKWENPDLFWAIRGAGSAFGIVGEFTFNTFAAPSAVTVFSIDPDWDEAKAVNGIKQLQDFIMSAPQEINIMMFIHPTNQQIHGVYYGSQADFEMATRSMLSPSDMKSASVHTVEWIQSLQRFSGGRLLNQTNPYQEHESIYATNLITRLLSDGQIRDLMSSLFSTPKDPPTSPNWSVSLEFHGGNMSAVHNVNQSDTSFAHRDKLLLHQYAISRSTPEAFSDETRMLKSFTRRVTGTMAPSDWGMYANYVDTEVDGNMAQELYWSESLDRLRILKSTYDPNEVFWNPQGIRPVGSS